MSHPEEEAMEHLDLDLDSDLHLDYWHWHKDGGDLDWTGN